MPDVVKNQQVKSTHFYADRVFIADSKAPISFSEMYDDIVHFLPKIYDGIV